MFLLLFPPYFISMKAVNCTNIFLCCQNLFTAWVYFIISLRSETFQVSELIYTIHYFWCDPLPVILQVNKMISLKTYLKKLTLEQRLALLQKLNIPKDSNNDEFMKHLLENKDYKNFCQEENSKEAKEVYQRILDNSNHPEEIRRIQNDFSKNIQNKENQFPLSFMKYFIAKNLDVKIDAKKRKKIHICEYCNKSFDSKSDSSYRDHNMRISSLSPPTM